MERIELSEKEKTKLYKHLAANYFNTLLTVAAVPILIFVAAFVVTTGKFTRAVPVSVIE